MCVWKSDTRINNAPAKRYDYIHTSYMSALKMTLGRRVVIEEEEELVITYAFPVYVIKSYRKPPL